MPDLRYRLLSSLCLLLTQIFAVSCTREYSECAGPKLNLTDLQSIRNSGFSTGPLSSLIVPNPIEASKSASTTLSEVSLVRLLEDFKLPNLSNPNRLENGFVHVRLHSMNDSEDLLAKPTNGGEYKYSLSDPKYSQVMAYHGVMTALKYVEALGFSLLTDRPLYVMSQARVNGAVPTEVNAYYDHNTLDPKAPRQLRLYGESTYAPGVDREMYWHEIGHYVNESVSGDVGIDRAGENGAMYTEGAALHECLADYLAESLQGQSHIGKWLARNFSEYQPGQPLRSAEDVGRRLLLSDVGSFDSKLGPPDRYGVAEWCSRVLWDIRKSFVEKSPEYGAMLSDRLILSAVSRLPKDASLSDFYSALRQTDDGMHCGQNKKAIRIAFEERGFVATGSVVAVPTVSIKPVSLTQDDKGNYVRAIGSQSSGFVGFEIQILNSSSAAIRNLRIKLESPNGSLNIATYLQGMGDLGPGQVAIVGPAMGGLSYAYSLLAKRTQSNAKYRIRILGDNLAESVDVDGVLP